MKCFFAFLCIISFVANGQHKDSILPAVQIKSIKAQSSVNVSVPVQIVTGEQLKTTSATNVADAVKYFSGVVVKDYGGIGGLKTISVRSLGANHTGIIYDGILLSDMQSGQIDLGRYAIQNISSIALYNPQSPELLNTARASASASALVIKTHPSKVDDSSSRLQAGVSGGSFGYFKTHLSGRLNLNKYWSVHGNGFYNSAKGHYPFTDYSDQNKTVYRSNSDIKAYNGEANLNYQKENSVFNIKSYYYHSERGLPGSVILYNGFSNERLSHENFFIQSTYKFKPGTKIDVLLNGKYNFLYNHYLKPATVNGNDYENIFKQKEYYASAGLRYNISSKFEAAYATDYFHNALTRKDNEAIGFAFPLRNTWLNNISFKSEWSRAVFQANLLHTNITNKVRAGNTPGNFNRLSPTVSAIIQPFQNTRLKLRVFYKNIFRVPSFNDLYYTMVGNTRLRPETANQFNIGVTFLSHFENLLERIDFTTDFYHNNVKDKIVAVPRENLFQWSMQNLGMVKINGIDAAAILAFKEINNWDIQTNINYSFQHAVDVTDPASPLYKNQIPYTPRHSGSLRITTSHKRFSAGYNFLFSGYRYRIGEILVDNYLPGWATHDVTLRYKIPSAKLLYELFFDINNITNKQYEVVMYYPMPRFNYRLGAQIELKNIFNNKNKQL